VEFALLGSDVTPVLEIAPDLWPCDCDQGQVGQVINNLLINARQASTAGGVVSVKASNVDKLGHYVMVTIHDQGPGIPPDILGRIFDPFFTTKPDGSGLGLAIAFSIIRQHGGWIEASSTRAEGTTLSLYLPALPQGTSAPKGDDALAAFHGSGVAVIMDDGADILEAVGEQLVGLGYEVVRSASGQQALNLYSELTTSGRPVEVFLLDNHVREGMGGLATAQRLRGMGNRSQIVLMSGNFDSGTGRVADDGLWRLAKPFTNEELSSVLSEQR
jgi:CheY-like chemotaxis protein